MKGAQATVALVIGVAVALALASPAWNASSRMSVNWSPVVTENPSNGDTIRLTGGGTFDPAALSVNASGSFTHYDSTGAVLARGSWRSVDFVSFVEFGRLNNGLVGGILTITVRFFAVPGPTTGIGPLTMTIDCEIGRGSEEDEGVDVGPFTENLPGFGTTVFHAGS